MKESRAFKGVWIPSEIWLSKELKPIEKMLLIEIDSLDNGDGCFGKDKEFAKFFDITTERVSQLLCNLRDKGLISVDYGYLGEATNISRRIVRIKEELKGGIEL